MRVLIVDDHAGMRAGIAHGVQALWPEAEIDTAASLAAALAQSGRARPDVVTLDLSLPDAQGTEGVSRMLQALPGVPLLVLSLHAQARLAQHLMQMGAAGYVPKERLPEELGSALCCLRAGGHYLSTSLA